LENNPHPNMTNHYSDKPVAKYEETGRIGGDEAENRFSAGQS
jgi:hypothetical protein